MQPEHLKRAIYLFIAAFAMAAASLMAFQQPAQAGGSVNPGTGGCVSDTNPRFVTQWSGFKAGGSDNSPMYCNGSTILNRGKSRGQLANLGGNGEKCYDERSTIEGLWYLTITGASNEWFFATTRNTHSVFTTAINNSGLSAEAKQVARNKLGRLGPNVVMLCVLESEVSTSCNDYAWWNTHVRKSGASGGDRYRTEAAAKTGCLAVCPNQTDARPGRVGGYINKSTADTNNNNAVSAAELGAFCFYKAPDNEDFKETQTAVYDTITDTRAETNNQPLADYAWRTSVASGTDVRPAGTQNITAQSEAMYTPYGDWLNTRSNAGGESTDPWPSKAAAAAMNAGKVHKIITLQEDGSVKNKTALAQGAVANVNEHTTYAPMIVDTRTYQPKRNWRWQRRTTSYSFSWSQGTSRTRSSANTCTRLTPGTWTTPGGTTGSAAACNNWGAWAYNVNDVGSWQNDPARASWLTYDTRLGTQTQENTAFWQSLTNHCNATGYNSAAARGNVNVDNGDSSKNWSGSNVSARRANSTSSANWMWGSGSTDPRGTNTVGFFDKECAYNGIRATDDNTPASTTVKPMPMFQTFFRDNKTHDLKVDLFVPKSEGVVSYNSGMKALTTTITRWTGGTPLLEGESNKGQFILSLKNNNAKVFGLTVVAPPQQRNWGTTTWTSKEGAQVNGQHNTLNIAANWASDTGKPHAFQFKWEYAPNVSNRFPTTLGFGRDGARASGVPADCTGGLAASACGALETVATPIQGKVYGGGFGENMSPAMFDLQLNNTGTGTTNTIDNRLIENMAVDGTGKWTMQPNTFSRYYLGVQFVRGTTD